MRFGDERGTSLVEILVAGLLIGVALVPLLQLYPRSLETNLETETDLLLAAQAMGKMEEMINILRPASTGGTPGKTFYLHKEVSAMTGNWLAKDGVVPEVTENTATQKKSNWSLAAGAYVLMKPGVINASTGTPSTTPQGFGWWSNAALNMTIPAGTWTFALRKSDGGGGATAAWHVRVYRVPQNTSKTGAVELFNTASANWTLTGTTAVTITWTTASVGPFTLTNQYLLVEIWVKAVTTFKPGVTFRVEGSTLADADRAKVITPSGGGGEVADPNGNATCSGPPSCRLVWTTTDELSSATQGVGKLKTLKAVACVDTNGNAACDTGEKQVRYDAKVTTRP